MDSTQIQRGQQWLQEFLRLAGLPAAVKTEMSSAIGESSCWLTIDDTQLTPEQIQGLTGADGSVIDSVQYLANTILNIGVESDQQGAFTIDLDGYRQRRYAELQAIADRAAERVRETGAEYELQALSAAERRQLHTLLKECPDLETYSRGQEPDRRLVVKLREG